MKVDMPLNKETNQTIICCNDIALHKNSVFYYELWHDG